MIEISNVTKTYNPKKSNAFTALKNVSLTINDGEMIAIIGKSGAGTSSDTSSEPASSTPATLIAQQALHGRGYVGSSDSRGDKRGHRYQKKKQFFQYLPAPSQNQRGSAFCPKFPKNLHNPLENFTE